MRKIVFSILFLVFISIFGTCINTAQAGNAVNVVSILNKQYGRVCKAELTGWFTKTLVINWTANTKKIDAIKILAEIGTVKEILYDDSVRYLQFPNDMGTYNIIDWKTGEKKSISDKARYYFP